MDNLEARIDTALRRPKPELCDAGFSDQLMASLPRRRLRRSTARRLTLGGAALAGSVLTSVLGAPLETVFSSFVLEGSAGVATLAVIGLLGLIALPVAWVLYSR